MKPFMDKDFLLESETAKLLFHKYAKDTPIFDFHNHLSVQEIYEDVQLDGITYAWLGFDHYKWRAERSFGVEEDYITGDKEDYEKFSKWAETVPALFGNPLYHWTHLELQRFFDIQEPLTPSSAKMIYEKCNEMLKTKACSVRQLILQSNVKALCTTDDPCDDLRYHKALKEEGFAVKVLPAFRADQAIHIEKPTFLPYMKRLEETVGYPMDSYASLEKAMLERVDYFHEAGCRFADHGLDEILYLDASKEEVEVIFAKALQEETLTRDEIRKFHGALQNALGKKYHALGWVMQLHIGPMRNNSTRRFQSIGADAGFDSMNDGQVAVDLSRFLDSLDISDELPKTILYCLNPKDNGVLASMLGNFQGGGIAGKLQFGPGWWFNDNKDGMIEHIKVLSAMGLLSQFVGMLTDSRSFLSFPRHEYFRRILCNEVGRLVENGEYPFDEAYLGKMIQDICVNNIVRYSGISID